MQTTHVVASSLLHLHLHALSGTASSQYRRPADEMLRPVLATVDGPGDDRLHIQTSAFTPIKTTQKEDHAIEARKRLIRSCSQPKTFADLNVSKA